MEKRYWEEEYLDRVRATRRKMQEGVEERDREQAFCILLFDVDVSTSTRERCNND
jgi:hypothetical protein